MIAIMKTGATVLIMMLILFNACSPKSYSETSIGKEKWEYYNKTQYGLQPRKAPKF